jgi:hypothetical protein
MTMTLTVDGFVRDDLKRLLERLTAELDKKPTDARTDWWLRQRITYCEKLLNECDRSEGPMSITHPRYQHAAWDWAS